MALDCALVWYRSPMSALSLSGSPGHTAPAVSSAASLLAMFCAASAYSAEAVAGRTLFSPRWAPPHTGARGEIGLVLMGRRGEGLF